MRQLTAKQSEAVAAMLGRGWMPRSHLEGVASGTIAALVRARAIEVDRSRGPVAYLRLLPDFEAAMLPPTEGVTA